MYSAHRGMGVPAPNNRLTELLDQVRAEFESVQSSTRDYEQNSMLLNFLVEYIVDFQSRTFCIYKMGELSFHICLTQTVLEERRLHEWLILS